MLEILKDKEKLKELFVQFMKFGVIGFINTIITYVITNTCYYAFNWHAQVSNLFSFVITVFIGFILNRKFVFQQDTEKLNFWKSLAKVYASYSITGLFLTAVLLYIEEQIFGIPHYIATLMNLIVTVPANFILNKLWAFK